LVKGGGAKKKRAYQLRDALQVGGAKVLKKYRQLGCWGAAMGGKGQDLRTKGAARRKKKTKRCYTLKKLSGGNAKRTETEVAAQSQTPRWKKRTKEGGWSENEGGRFPVEGEDAR